MKQVMIFCNAGMSSSLMAKKVTDLLQKKDMRFTLMPQQPVMLKILSIRIFMICTLLVHKQKCILNL